MQAVPVPTFYGGNQDPIMWMNEFNNAFAKLLYNILSYLFSALQHDGRILTSEGHHLVYLPFIQFLHMLLFCISNKLYSKILINF